MRRQHFIHHPTRPEDVLLVAVPETAVAVVTVRTRHGLRRRVRRAIVPASSSVVVIATPGDRRGRCSVEVRTPTGVRRSRVTPVAALPGTPALVAA